MAHLYRPARAARPRAARLLSIVMLSLAVPAPAWAQAQSEIFGRVTDGTGAVLPGATVTLTSESLITPQTTVSADSGAYRFPSIPLGTYTVVFELPGFSRLVRENVRVETGFKAEINAQLQVSSVQETVTVSAASPVIDTRSTTTGQTFTREMLERIPSARDPWVMMEQTPGIVMTDQNVGGNKSGQQSTFTARGTANNEVWNIDGGNVTDMAASASSIYFDFDAFEEIQIQTGGSDASVQSSGVSINLVTKSGSNTFHGSSRVLVVDNNLQGDNITPELREQGAGSGNPIKNIKDYGFDIGGPIKRNKAWFWGAGGYQDIEVGVVGFTVPGGDPNNPEDLFTDLTKLKTYNTKLQYQWSQPHKSTFLYNFNDKIRNARNAGPRNPPDTTVRQTAPVSTFKVSHQWVPTNRLSLDVQAMTMPNGGFVLDFQRPELADVQASFDISSQMNGRSTTRNEYRRPQKEVRADGNYFLTSVLGGDNAMKFGVGWRDTPFGQTNLRGGDVQARFDRGRPVEVNLYRNTNTETALYQVFSYIQNAYTRGRVTINAGVRFDYQDDGALSSRVEANRLFPEILPAVDFAGADSDVPFDNWSPRLGFTWDLAGDGRNVVKGNAAVYFGTGITTATYVNPNGEANVRYPWNDLNGDGFVQRNEVDLTRLLDRSTNVDPANPGAPRSVTTVDPNLKNDRTDEFSIGFERELAGNIGVGAAFIVRNMPRYENFTPVDGVSAADYVPVTQTFTCGNSSCDQPSYSVTYYQLPFTQPVASTRRNADRTRRYRGLELTARKRFSDRWMVNASANFQTNRFFYGGPDVAFQDPTEIDRLDGAQTGAQNARWLGKVSGLYVVPWQDIGVSGFLNLRQGYPFNRVIQSPNRSGGLGRADVDIDRYGDVRYDNFYQFDMRVEKQFPIGAMKWAVSVDLFNVFNAVPVLDRQERQNNTTANNVDEVLAPRVARLGVRLTF